MSLSQSQAPDGTISGLRRADWRFLLPNPGGIFEHLLLFGGPEHLPQALVHHGIARQVSTDVPAGEAAVNAVAILHGAQVNWISATSRLAAGGALYYEIDRRSLAGLRVNPGRFLQSLREAGFNACRLYWAAPDFDHCKRYIPLDIPEPFRWYLSTLYLAGTPRHRLLELALRLYGRIPHLRFASIVPCIAITATRGSEESFYPSLLGHSSVPAALRQPRLHPVLLTSGQDDGSRAVLLPFLPGSSQPLAVVKISTLPAYNINIEREQVNLASMRARLDPGLLATIPSPLGRLLYGNISAGLESCANGRPMFITSGRWPASFHQRVEDLRLAAGWLREFHHLMQDGRSDWNVAAHQAWVDAPLTAYAETFGLTPAEEHLFSCARERSLSLTGAALPIVRMHYDFIPGNIYRSGSRITVIDWEYGGNWHRKRFGPALYDLLFYVTFWIHLVDRANDEDGEMRSFYRLFIDPGKQDRYVQAARRAIDDYIASLAIEPRFLPLILVYLWVEQALHRFFRWQSLDEGKIRPRAGNKPVRRVGVLAEHTDRLFAV